MLDAFGVDDFESYIGQHELKERLGIHIESANKRQATLDHILLTAPPGAGKTTISGLIADALCVDFAEFMMPIKPQLLTTIAHGHFGVVLFDEIHRCSDKQQEQLLPLIQSNYYQTDGGVVIPAPNLCVIGATTEPEKIIKPLYERFKIKPKFEPYTDLELSQIAKGMAKKAGVKLTRRQLRKIGRAAGGIPRNAASMIVMARDLYTVRGYVDVKDVIRRCNFTEAGLTDDHLEYLRLLAKKSPSGIEVIASQMKMPKTIVLDLEHLLLTRELIQLTNGGREILSAGYKAIK